MYISLLVLVDPFCIVPPPVRDSRVAAWNVGVLFECWLGSVNNEIQEWSVDLVIQ